MEILVPAGYFTFALILFIGCGLYINHGYGSVLLGGRISLACHYGRSKRGYREDTVMEDLIPSLYFTFAIIVVVCYQWYVTR